MKLRPTTHWTNMKMAEKDNHKEFTLTDKEYISADDQLINKYYAHKRKLAMRKEKIMWHVTILIIGSTIVFCGTMLTLIIMSP